MNAEPILECRSVAAGHGRLQVLFDVTFELYPGEILAVTGGNGAGKSTLLSALSGLLRPLWSGEVAYKGHRIDTQPAWDIAPLGLVHVLERRRLAPFLSVIDNLKLSEATVPKGSRSEWRDRFETLRDSHPLIRSHGNRHAEELSGGQQQLVAVLRGLLAGPEVLLLDEPYQGLDLAVASGLTDLLTSAVEEGVSIVLTEHRAEIIESLESRQVFLERGRLVAQPASDGQADDETIPAHG